MQQFYTCRFFITNNVGSQALSDGIIVTVMFVSDQTVNLHVLVNVYQYDLLICEF